MTRTDSRRLYLNGTRATEHFALAMSRLAKKGDFLALFGVLGAGKTSFARAFIRAMTDPDIEVPSPTFTLMQYYQGRVQGETVQICHADFYRLRDPEEVEELGLREFQGIILLEWPERMGILLPEHALHIHFHLTKEESVREILMKGSVEWMKRLKGLPEQFS